MAGKLRVFCYLDRRVTAVYAAFVCRHAERIPFVNERNTKGIPFLSKLKYKRVRDWTSTRSLPV